MGNFKIVKGDMDDDMTIEFNAGTHANNWQHYTIERRGNSTQFYVDGVEYDSTCYPTVETMEKLDSRYMQAQRQYVRGCIVQYTDADKDLLHRIAEKVCNVRTYELLDSHKFRVEVDFAIDIPSNLFYTIARSQIVRSDSMPLSLFHSHFALTPDELAYMASVVSFDS